MKLSSGAKMEIATASLLALGIIGIITTYIGFAYCKKTIPCLSTIGTIIGFISGIGIWMLPLIFKEKSLRE